MAADYSRNNDSHAERFELGLRLWNISKFLKLTGSNIEKRITNFIASFVGRLRRERIEQIVDPGKSRIREGKVGVVVRRILIDSKIVAINTISYERDEGEDLAVWNLPFQCYNAQSLIDETNVSFRQVGVLQARR
jgi:hypothetical protein